MLIFGSLAPQPQSIEAEPRSLVAGHHWTLNLTPDPIRPSLGPSRLGSRPWSPCLSPSRPGPSPQPRLMDPSAGTRLMDLMDPCMGSEVRGLASMDPSMGFKDLQPTLLLPDLASQTWAWGIWPRCQGASVPKREFLIQASIPNHILKNDFQFFKNEIILLISSFGRKIFSFD